MIKAKYHAQKNTSINTTIVNKDDTTIIINGEDIYLGAEDGECQNIYAETIAYTEQVNADRAAKGLAPIGPIEIYSAVRTDGIWSVELLRQFTGDCSAWNDKTWHELESITKLSDEAEIIKYLMSQGVDEITAKECASEVSS